MKACALLVLASLGTCPARAEVPESVLVTTVAPHRGTLPDILTAYGTARPALDAATTLSRQLDGQVTAIAVTPGEAVQAGQHLLDFHPSASAISTYRQAVTALRVAGAARAHTAELLSGHLATRDQLDAADKAVSDARSTLDALTREGAAETSVAIDAPFAGIVDTVPVAQGARVAPGVPLVTLTARNGLVVTLGVDPAARGSVGAGDAVRLARLSGGPALAGRVLRIDGVLDPLTRMVDVDVSVASDQILSGEAFRGGIVVGRADGWVVPHDAVLSDEKGAWLFQVAGGKGVRVGIRVIARQGGTDVVAGPIDPSRPIVNAGAYQLENGMAVRIGPHP